MQGYPPVPPVCPECRKPMKLVRTIPRLGALRENDRVLGDLFPAIGYCTAGIHGGMEEST